MLYFVGLGLWDEKDITLKGLEVAKKCDRLYAEFYTSKLGVRIEEVEKIVGKKIKLLKREDIENGGFLLEEAKEKDVCLFVCGDPMTATTHVELRIRAIEHGIKTRIIHGISIVCASASFLGLQIYKFGRIANIVKPIGDYFPLSPYDVIKENKRAGLHTLVLLDIYNGMMTANEAMEIMLEMEKKRKEGILGKNTLIVVLARVSSEDAVARAGYIEELIEEDFGDTPHCIVIPSKLHIMEAKALEKFAQLKH